MAKKVRRTRRMRQKEVKADAAEKSRYEAIEDELRQEYAYVLKDLRRVFILAALMFLLLIALNLLI